ncbi:hypothetical protein PILCRDRAFT_305170 [Piloderma croceum F 1598]|uniref:Uncharacterized protein n=1 Tax=Piloderma croceum (strain F 1598) TaxID=765440 RepID=A0A0C3BLB2_PILCF|nr:hypothetical protein PILCRDRAFT_305170 [Piloderma croceum F 1598]
MTSLFITCFHNAIVFSQIYCLRLIINTLQSNSQTNRSMHPVVLKASDVTTENNN